MHARGEWTGRWVWPVRQWLAVGALRRCARACGIQGWGPGQGILIKRAQPWKRQVLHVEGLALKMQGLLQPLGVCQFRRDSVAAKDGSAAPIGWTTPWRLQQDPGKGG